MKRSAKIKGIPLTTITITPNKIPLNPALSTLPKLIPAPKQNAKNGIIIATPGFKNSLISVSRFPKTTPTNNGPIAAKSPIKGIFASPEAPSTTRVKKGPSLILRILCDAISVGSPYSPINAINKPPLPFVTELIIAKLEIPKNPTNPNTLATIIPRAAPAINFARSNTEPLFKAWGACFKSNWLPIHTKATAIVVAVPLLEKTALLKDPRFNRAGKNVLRIAPNNSGTTIKPPGTFFTDFKIFM